MIIIIDYKVGNIGSIINMFKKIGVQAKLSANKEEIVDATKLILPGVGSYDNGMKHLHSADLIEVLNQKVLGNRTPILGICLGMQLLLDKSEEGQEKGLGWIKGDVKRFDFNDNKNNLKIPHMGWNLAKPVNTDNLFKGFEEDARFYFVHSYHAVCFSDQNVLANSFHGYEFTSVINKENIFGAQFHPEKSHKFGMKLLKNFMAYT